MSNSRIHGSNKFCSFSRPKCMGLVDGVSVDCQFGCTSAPKMNFLIKGSQFFFCIIQALLSVVSKPIINLQIKVN
jgi:hypothetical protein